MAGTGEQHTIIIPSHDLVVVRSGRYTGQREATGSLNRALERLLEAVPANR